MAPSAFPDEGFPGRFIVFPYANKLAEHPTKSGDASFTCAFFLPWIDCQPYTMRGFLPVAE